MALGDGLQGGSERFLWPELCGGARWRIFLTVFITRLVATVLALLLVGGVWNALKPEKPAPDRVRLAAANVCAKAIREDLRERRGDYRTLVCVPFAGDSTDAAFDATREALVSSGTFDVCGKSFGERFRDYFGLSASGSNDSEKAARTARRRKADAALCGSVLRFETVDGRAALVVEYRLIDAATGNEAFAGTYDSTKKDASAPVSADGSNVGAESDAIRGAARDVWVGVALWILAVLATPIVSFRLLEAATAKRSNGANAFALSACFVADAAFAWILVRPTFENAASILGVVAMGVFALWYDAQALRLAHRRTEDVPISE